LNLKMVRVRNNQNEPWIIDRIFVGIASSGDAIVEHKGGFSRFKYYQDMPQKKKVPLDIEKIVVLSLTHVWFKRGESGRPFINPCIQEGIEEGIVFINGIDSREILFAENRNVPEDNWQHLEESE